MPIVNCSDLEQLKTIMMGCGMARAITYNKLGSIQGWGLHWKQADPLVRAVHHPNQIGIPSKIFEWSVSDCFKGITAQQEAAKVAIIRKIYRKYPITQNEQDRWDWVKQNNGSKKASLEKFPPNEVELSRLEILDKLQDDPISNSWLHRHFRKEYVRGHTYLKNQIVYQKAGYKATRSSRDRVLVEVAGLQRGKRIKLVVKTNRLPIGQIRIIDKDGRLELHTAFTQEIPSFEKPKKSLGMDKGYTEGFYLSDGRIVAEGLGKLMTKKTERIAKKGKNRSRLWHHAKNHPSQATRIRIQQNNLGRKVKERRLNRDQAEIRGLIRSGLRTVLTEPTQIFAEDLSSPIRCQRGAKRINRKLNAWIKGELQVSLEKIGESTGSIVTTVNPAYTSQTDHLTGTLLGSRKGDRFYRYNGDVLQSDDNAARVILSRGTDSQIQPYMKVKDVRAVLQHRTVRYLHSQGYSLEDAFANSWLSTKYKAELLAVEAEYPPVGYRRRLSTKEEEYIQLELPL